jgi:hypothetical protein
MSCVELQSVRLSRFGFTSNLPLQGLDSQIEISSASRFSSRKTEGQLVIFFDLSLKGHSKDVEVISVNATIEATYAVPNESEFSDFQVKSFAKSNGMINVWPYWREYVHAATQRAGLAALTLPLFRVIHKAGSQPKAVTAP